MEREPSERSEGEETPLTLLSPGGGEGIRAGPPNGHRDLLAVTAALRTAAARWLLKRVTILAPLQAWPGWGRGRRGAWFTPWPGHHCGPAGDILWHLGYKATGSDSPKRSPTSLLYPGRAPRARCEARWLGGTREGREPRTFSPGPAGVRTGRPPTGVRTGRERRWHT